METKFIIDWATIPFFVKIGIVAGTALMVFNAGRELGKFIYHIVNNCPC